MEVLKKINQAIEIIKKTKLKKEGRNSYSNYDYFTPDQIDILVYSACNPLNLHNKFDLIRNEFGIYGKLTVTDLDTNTFAEYFMASDIPSIKATNISQQLGGSMTYTKRYLFMNVYSITDHNLDFDTSSNTAVSDQKKTLTVKHFNHYMKEGTADTIQQVLDNMVMTKQQRTSLETLVSDQIMSQEIKTEYTTK